MQARGPSFACCGSRRRCCVRPWTISGRETTYRMRVMPLTHRLEATATLALIVGLSWSDCRTTDCQGTPGDCAILTRLTLTDVCERPHELFPRCKRTVSSSRTSGRLPRCFCLMYMAIKDTLYLRLLVRRGQTKSIARLHHRRHCLRKTSY